MEDWMCDAQLLGHLHDAATLLASACDCALQTVHAQEKQAEESAAKLAGAVEKLRELLQLVLVPGQAAGACLPPAAACRPHQDAATAQSDSPLLRLPNELLHRIAHEVGKEARAVCGRLRDVYGRPGHTVRQPLSGFELDGVVDFEDGDGYNLPRRQLQSSILRQLYERHASKFSLAGVHSCDARWPGWAGQVTRLELSDTYTPGTQALQLISQALPGLRELSLAMAPISQVGDEPLSKPLPQLSGVTQLCMLCSASNLLAVDRVRYGAVSVDVLSAVPSLRSLHLDLRFVHSDLTSLQAALQPLQHLAHLELVFGPAEDVLPDDQYTAGVRGALASLADRLESLVFLAPVAALGPDIVTALQSLTRLTCLGWCIGWGTDEDPAGWAFDNSDWLHLPASVRQLVVGFANPAWVLFENRVQDLLQAVEGSASVLPELRSLALPHLDLEADEGPFEALQTMLQVVAARCPEVTSLQLGVHIDGFDWQSSTASLLPIGGTWLQPVAQMRHLQQLVLSIDAHALGAMSGLAGLPHLNELWLNVPGASHVQHRLQHDPSYQPGIGLAQLTTLTLLAVRLPGSLNEGKNAAHGSIDEGRGTVHALLPAVARLPRLQVLDLSEAQPFTVVEEPWLALASSAPCQLREVRLCRPCCDSWLVAHQRTLALLTKHLPTSVVVTECEYQACKFYAWAPMHGGLARMSVRWGRQWGNMGYSVARPQQQQQQ